ncbi:MAG: response regulator [Candidatus Magasanikbacteria bacterium]|nr:response regulator [Candidatus Magasanikbacteria bacterium]
MLRQRKPDGNQPNILLVESDAFLADIYEKNLLMEDFKVSKATNGERAIKMLESKGADLVLLAVVLPKMNGFEVLSAIRSNVKTATIPVLMLSKLGTVDDVRKSRELGATGYIIKTHFMPSEIVEKIKRVLYNKK